MVGQPPACSISDCSGAPTLLNSSGSAMVWELNICGVTAAPTGRSILWVSVGISRRAAGISQSP